MSVEDRLRRLAERVQAMSVAGFSEREAERNLVEPFLEALGYDSRNPNEVKGQLPIQIGSTTKSCDYAISIDGEVRVLVEVKRPRVDLDSPGQLGSYFSQVQTALLGIYTNGLEYRFYAERNRNRVKRMDSDPFLVLDVRRLNPAAMARAARCSKDQLRDAEGFQHWAAELGYARAIHDRLRSELTGHPSDELVRLAMDWAGVEVKTPEEVARFRRVVKDAASGIVHPNPVEPPPVEPGPRRDIISLDDIVRHIESWGTTTGPEMRKRAPKLVKFPDGTEVQLKAWYHVVVETAYWLYQNQLLSTANCEIQDAGHPDSHILSPGGKHRDGREFRYGGEPIRDTGIRVNKDLGAIRLMENAIKLLRHFEQDASQVSLIFS
ncbi:MAG: type I restriction enzyme HsdR N-terminal domain-containing protein [Chloroflexota bacterium]|nr:type I restriction enzyme HsdR N-terminal domain-containing protein [Chloroflexota bacterium]MDE2885109.1 type I restriction enzyme HsdR N-terminal domain-containing protein [Chloroflexota bacterium]